MRDSTDLLPIVRRPACARARAPIFALLVAAAVAVTGHVPRARAATFNVPCNATALASALATANANGEEDLLWLAPSCVYPLAATFIVRKDSGNPLRVYGRGATLSGQSSRPVVAIDAEAALYMEAVTLRDGISAASGAGVDNAGTLSLHDVTITGGTAQGRGGGLNNAGVARLSRTTISGNRANAAAGGIANVGGARRTVIDSALSQNIGTYGGALYNTGRLAVFNSTLFENTGFVGGGLMNEPLGKALLGNVTITGNQVNGPGGGGGIRNHGTLRIDNSIVANHDGYGDCSNQGPGTIVPLSTNLIEDGSCNVVAAITGDPQLGGPTGTPKYFTLAASSPALDVGSNPTCAGRDQRGTRRPFDGNQDGYAICDLGAFERGGAACGLLGIEGLALLPWLRRTRRRSRRAGA